MSTFKRTKVVMLPTKENKSGVLKRCLTGSLHFDIHDNSNLYKSQHLHFLSDEEIKVGDWCVSYDRNNKNPLLLHWTSEGTSGRAPFYKRLKIIATTDKSLTVISPGYEWPISPLGQPSQGFIKKFCDKGGIYEVLVEYEKYVGEKSLRIARDPDTIYDGSPLDERLKVSSDNTITIKAIKNNWSREEVEAIVLGFAKDAGKDEDLVCHYNGDYMDAKQWLKEIL